MAEAAEVARDRDDAKERALREAREAEAGRMSVEEFVDRFYRPDRLRGRGRRERVIADRTEDLHETGSAMISRHESVTGDAVVLYNPRWRPKRYIKWLATTDGRRPHPNPQGGEDGE